MIPLILSAFALAAPFQAETRVSHVERADASELSEAFAERSESLARCWSSAGSVRMWVKLTRSGVKKAEVETQALVDDEAVACVLSAFDKVDMPRIDGTATARINVLWKEAPPQHVVLDQPVIAGGIDPMALTQVVTDMQTDLHRCVAARTNKRGRIVVSLKLSDQGTVTEIVSRADDIGDRDANACVLQTLTTRRFPAPPDTSSMIVLPLRFVDPA